jgi:hypothetical protein
VATGIEGVVEGVGGGAFHIASRGVGGIGKGFGSVGKGAFGAMKSLGRKGDKEALGSLPGEDSSPADPPLTSTQISAPLVQPNLSGSGIPTIQTQLENGDSNGNGYHLNSGDFGTLKIQVESAKHLAQDCEKPQIVISHAGKEVGETKAGKPPIAEFGERFSIKTTPDELTLDIKVM